MNGFSLQEIDSVTLVIFLVSSYQIVEEMNSL
jgi:hypothetical protein